MGACSAAGAIRRLRARRSSGSTRATTSPISKPPTRFRTKSPEIRKWRVILVTRYEFSEGRLRGFSVGGAVRWQDMLGIRYPFIIDAAGNDVADLSRPYLGPDELQIDMSLANAGGWKSSAPASIGTSALTSQRRRHRPHPARPPLVGQQFVPVLNARSQNFSAPLRLCARPSSSIRVSRPVRLRRRGAEKSRILSVPGASVSGRHR
jgi:hypothetical protein